MFFVDFPKGAKIILPKIYKYFTNFDKIRHINDLKQFQTDTLERQKEIFRKITFRSSAYIIIGYKSLPFYSDKRQKIIKNQQIKKKYFFLLTF